MTRPVRFARATGCVALALIGALGMAKLLDLETFRRSLDSWSLVPASARPALTIAVPSLEVVFFLAAILWGVWRWFCVAAGCLCTVFAAAAAVHLMNGARPECNCAGVLAAYAAWSSGTTLLIAKSGILAVLCFVGALGFRASHGEPLPRPSARTAAGFTLVELLLCVFVVALLLSLFVAGLAGAKKSAAATGTASNLRSCTQLVLQYTADWRDTFPIVYPAGHDGEFVVSGGGAWTARVYRYFDNSEYWHLAVAMSGEPASALQPGFYRTGDPTDLRSPGPSFAMSCAMFASPDFFDLTLRTGESQYRAVRHSEVRHPALKALLIDYSSIIREGRSLGWGGGVVHATFVDGSVYSAKGDRFKPGVASGEGTYRGWAHPLDMYPGGHTDGGVRGTDRY